MFPSETSEEKEKKIQEFKSENKLMLVDNVMKEFMDSYLSQVNDLELTLGEHLILDNKKAQYQKDINEKIQSTLTNNVVQKALEIEMKKPLVVTSQSLREGRFIVEAYTTECGKIGFDIASTFMGQLNMTKGMTLEKICEKVDKVHGVRVIGNSKVSVWKETLSNGIDVKSLKCTTDIAKAFASLSVMSLIEKCHNEVNKVNNVFKVFYNNHSVHKMIEGSVKIYDTIEEENEYIVNCKFVSYGAKYEVERWLFFSSSEFCGSFEMEEFSFGIKKNVAKVYSANLEKLALKFLTD